jgi:hypothetical protein
MLTLGGGGGGSSAQDAAAVMRSAAVIDPSDPDAPALMLADENMTHCAWEDVFNDSKFLKQGEAVACVRAQPHLGPVHAGDCIHASVHACGALAGRVRAAFS